MQIPKISHVPIQQPMYFNGVMHQAWVNFFERLATLSNSADMIQLVELAQKVGEQVSSQAVQGQHGFDIATMQHSFEAVPITINQTQELPPLQAVFLCQEQPFSMVGLPPSGVISP